VNALDINHKASHSFKAQGDSQAEISAGGQTIVKGSLVLIN
jgi:hypothetical protein